MSAKEARAVTIYALCDDAGAIEGSPRKRCRSCARLLERSAFYRYATNRDGLHTRCKECVRAYYRERYRAKRAASLGGRREAEGGSAAEEQAP